MLKIGKEIVKNELIECKIRFKSNFVKSLDICVNLAEMKGAGSQCVIFQ